MQLNKVEAFYSTVHAKSPQLCPTLERDGMGRELGGGSGWGTHVHPWLIHVNVCQNNYNIVK